jgi:hypothetical protein
MDWESAFIGVGVALGEPVEVVWASVGPTIPASASSTQPARGSVTRSARPSSGARPLALDPTRIASLARAIFAEARGARRAKVDAHPSDASVLREPLTTAGLDVQSIEIREDPTLARGELRLQTDLGNIDARLAPRFERLAAALRAAVL